MPFEHRDELIKVNGICKKLPRFELPAMLPEGHVFHPDLARQKQRDEFCMMIRNGPDEDRFKVAASRLFLVAGWLVRFTRQA